MFFSLFRLNHNNYYLYDIIMHYVPYFLCKEIIKKAKSGKYTHLETIKKLSFNDDDIYQKTNKVPLNAYLDLVYHAEKAGIDILSIYDKKEDILFNVSVMFPQLCAICLNQKNALTGVLSYLSLFEAYSENYSVKYHSEDKVEIIYTPFNEKLTHSIYHPLGIFLLISDIVKYYLQKPSKYKITMNFIGGSQPKYEKAVLADLSCKAHLNKRQNSIIIESSSMQEPFIAYNPLLSNFTNNVPFRIAQAESPLLDNKVEIIGKITTIIRQFYHSDSSPAEGKCPIDYVSSKLAIPVWTLQRKLLEINQTYSEILNNVLIELTHEFLIRNDYSIRETGERLGFSSQSAFSRFFKTMTGKTPLAYKKKC